MDVKRRYIRLLWLLVLLALTAVVSQLHVDTDMSRFLPAGSDTGERLLLEQLQHGGGSRMLLLALEGENRERLAELSNGLATAMRNSGRFEQVLNGGFSLQLATEEPWFRYRYLLGESDFSVTALRAALQQRLQELRSPLGLYVRQTLAEDPSAAFTSLLRRWQGSVAPNTVHGVWFAGDGRALLLAQTRAAGFELDAQQQNIDIVRTSFAELEGSETATLLLSGAPVMAVASRETIRSEAQLASVIASIAVALILLLAYRSLQLWLLGALPLAAAMLAALAVCSLVFGSVHGITIAFGVIVLGVAIDYPIHLFSHLVPAESTRASLRRVWPTLRLGALSTTIGFAALLFTQFEGLVQLGVFAVSGLLMAALVTRFLLPTLLPQQWTGREYRAGRGVMHAGRRSGLLAALVILLAAIAWLWQSERPMWERDVAALSPVPAAQRLLDRQLREAMPVSGPVRLLLMSGASAESLLQAQERLRPSLEEWIAEGVLDGYEFAAQRLPSGLLQRERQKALPAAEQLQRRLERAGEGLPFRADAFGPFIAAVEQSRHLPPLTLEQVRGTVPGLPLEQLLFERDGKWWALVRLSNVHNDELLQQRLAAAGDGLRYVDLRSMTSGMLERFRDAALHNLFWGGLLILLLIAVGSRSSGRWLRVVVPLSAAIAVTLALLHLLGERLTLFHLVSLLLVAGIGIDYGLFFSRDEAQPEQQRTRHALAVCAISTLTVFAILSLSRLPVLHAIGLTVFIGVAAAYLLARLAGATASYVPDEAPR